MNLRNIAIIAHVDHGKTTLVDKMLLAGKLFSDHETPGELIMDNNDLEKERAETERLMTLDYDKQSNDKLTQLLSYPDMRIRQKAQFALVLEPLYCFLIGYGFELDSQKYKIDCHRNHY